MKQEVIHRVFAHMPELSTPRLTLRKMRTSDDADMFDYASRPEVTRYLLWSPHPDRAYTREYLKYLATRYAAGTFYDWAVVLKESGRMVGTCGFTSIDAQNECAEIGYVLSPRVWGHEIAVEAVRAVLAFGFDRLLLQRIEARFIYGNEASLRVMQKVGMTFEGYRRQSMLIKGVRRDIGYSSILLDEYRALFPTWEDAKGQKIKN
ncbi:MAG: GNAT family N-acetyltransferase [Clostridia bacterium]|nr:GNAT family N-acetyltransferase [Clostridia bacterium]